MNPEDELLDEEDLPRGMTLDRIDIVGDPDGDDSALREAERADRARARGYDTPEDVAASVARKGAPAVPLELPEVGIGVDPEALARRRLDTTAGRERVHGPSRARRDIAEALDEYLGLSAAPRRAREAGYPMLADWLESGTSGSTGAVQGATMGFADELGGAAAAGGAALEGEDPVAAYTGRRDELRRLTASDRESSPVAYGLGELTGAVATAPLMPSLTGARAATGAARVGRAAAEGAAYGAGAGFGASEGDLTTTEGRREAAADTLMGGAGGAIAGTGGGLVAEGIGAGANALRRAAERADELRVASVVGSGNSPLSTRAQRDVAALPGGTRAAAERIRRMGIGSRMGTIEDAAREASRAVDDTDRALGGFYSELDAALPDGVPVDRFARSFEDVAGGLSANPETAALAQRQLNRADAWRTAVEGGERMAGRGPNTRTPPGRMSSRGVREALGTMREGVDFIGANEGRVAAGAELDAYRAGRSTLDDVAEEVLGAERAADFRPMRNDAATARTIDRYAREAAMRADRRGPSLTGSLAANAAASMGGGPLATLATGMGTGAIRARLPAMRATGAEAIRSMLESGGARRLGEYGPILGDALRRGSEVFMGTHHALMRTDPDYAATVEAATSEAPAEDWASEFIEEEPAEDWAAEFIEE